MILRNTNTFFGEFISDSLNPHYTQVDPLHQR